MINIIRKKRGLLLGTLFLGAPFMAQAQPICTVCTLAVGVGVGLSRWLGVDDLISGVWIGAFLAAITSWISEWLKTKTKSRKLKSYILPLTAVVFYITTIIPLDWVNIIGDPLNRIWGFDRLLVGIAFGTLFLVLGNVLHSYLKMKNNNKVYFPYQRVVVPVISLIILSFVFYYFVI